MGNGEGAVQQTIDGTKVAMIAVNGQPPSLVRCVMEGEIAADSTALEKRVRGGGESPALKPEEYPDLRPETYKDTVQAVMGHLLQRLRGGIDEAWSSARHGYGIGPALWGKKGEGMINSVEEQWARAFAEMTVFAAYGGPGENYGYNQKEELTITRLLDKNVTQAPYFPILMACQHLSTNCALTRGIPVEQFNPNGMTASNGTSYLPLFKEHSYGDYRVKNRDAGKGTKEAIAKIPSGLLDHIPTLFDPTPVLTPGSVFTYNSLGVDATGQTGKAHIASVLRIWGRHFQPIDTGPFAGGAHMDEGSADHDLQPGDSKIMTANPGASLNAHFVGAGYLYADKTVVTQEQVDYLRTARPLGFAQLMLADNKNIRFLSRLLIMYDGSDSFSVSRYIWSLRSLPANLTAVWILSIPKNAGLTADIAAGKAIKDMRPRSAKGEAQEKLLTSPLNEIPLLPTHVIISSGNPNDPQVHMYRRKIGPTSNVTNAADNWKKQGTGEEKFSNAIFPAQLRRFKVSGVVVDNKGTLASLGWLWRQMRLGSPDWTMLDPASKENPQVSDITSGIPYFGG
jgi:hypothetical protein